MALPKNHQMVIDLRRVLVAQMVARKLTQREIQQALAKDQTHWNPDTKKPWSLGTINGDIAWLTEDWKQRAAREMDELKGEQFGELEQVKREAWKTGNLNVVVSALKAQRDLLGMDAPAQQIITQKDWRNEIIELIRSGQIMPADVVEELGMDLATELFISAGIPIDASRSDEAPR